MVELLAVDKNGNYTYLDLSNEVSISLNKSIEDIEDFTARKGGYTKTFNIPGSSRNDKFFQSVFNVNATDFDSTLQSDCVIQYKGSDILRGTMRLNKIINSAGIVNYEVYIVETLTPFTSQLDGLNICDLDYEDIQHTIDYDTIVSTWEYTGGTYDSYSGLTGKVLYPLAQTGYDDEAGGYGTFDFSTSGFTSISGNPIQTTQFKPWLNLKYLVDKVFDKAGFTYESSFFDTQYFQSIFMLAGQSPTMGANLLEDRPDNQNFFEVQQSSYYNYPPDQLDDWVYVIFQEEEYDYLDSYTLATFPSQPGQQGAKNYFTAPIGGLYQFNFDANFNASVFFGASYIDFALRDIDTGAIIAQQSGFPVVSTPTVLDLYFNATLTKDQRVGLFVKFNPGQVTDPTVAFNSASLRLYSSVPLSTTGATINWNDNIPCGLSTVDFIRNVINYFNLVIVPTGESSFLIEPYNDFLSSTSGETRDWQELLDLSSTYTIEPLDFSLQRQLDLDFQDDPTKLGKFYIDNYDNKFGSKTYIDSNSLLTGENGIVFDFCSLPTNTVNNASDCDFVVPFLFEESREGEIVYERPVSSPPRLGFFTGMKTPITGDTSSTGTSFTGITWYMQSGTTEVEHTTYPVVNHLSLLTYTANTEVSDLNFTSNWDFWMQHSDMVGYTPNNAWNDFYRNPIELLYSTEARLFTGYFFLTPEQIKDINFNDRVYFLNAEWRLLEIQDGDITEPNIVKCKFLKTPYRIPSSTPIPPNYVEQAKPRTPAPTPTPTPNTLYWYFEELIGSPFANIEFEELVITEVSSGTQMLRSTALGSGSFGFASGTYNIYASFTYRNNVGSLNNLQLTFGTSSGDSSYGILQIPQPADLTFYELSVDVYLPASGNLYATFDTY